MSNSSALIRPKSEPFQVLERNERHDHLVAARSTGWDPSHSPCHRIEVGLCRKQEVRRTSKSLTYQVSDGLGIKPATLEGIFHGRVRSWYGVMVEKG